MDWFSTIDFNIDNAVLEARISDNVLDDEDWGIQRITLRNGVVVEQQSVMEGCYEMPSMLGWNTTMLARWAAQDYTGSHPENYYELRLVKNLKAEKDRIFRVYKQSVGKKRKDGLRLVKYYGCDGKEHRITYCHLLCDRHGNNVSNGKSGVKPDKVLGKCQHDMTCKHFGEFIGR